MSDTWRIVAYTAHGKETVEKGIETQEEAYTLEAEYALAFGDGIPVEMEAE